MSVGEAVSDWVSGKSICAEHTNEERNRGACKQIKTLFRNFPFLQSKINNFMKSLRPSNKKELSISSNNKQNIIKQLFMINVFPVHVHKSLMNNFSVWKWQTSNIFSVKIVISKLYFRCCLTKGIEALVAKSTEKV